ncbi:RHS repeat-associated core domain-containing protein [Candidatus Gracilibacteria bacterium]|nr:RHS repeat-associated core domain-containing protein [Candidatus Gracilibacteria bacterium]
MTLKKNYLNSIGTDAVLAYDNEEGISLTSTGKIISRYYYHTNQLGSIIAISTSTGFVVQKYTYNAHGKPYIYSGSTLTPLSSYTGTLYGNSRLYTGREFENDTGYYYMRARYQSSDLGRFISRDPIGQNDQVNLYTYVKNSPLNYTDRNGKTGKPVLIIKGVETNNKNYGFVRDATKITRQRLESNGVSQDNIQEIDAGDFDHFKSIFDDINIGKMSYSQIIIIAHGTPGTMLLSNGDNGHLNEKNVSQISMNSEFSTPINLESCETGYGDNSIAELLAKQLGTTVMAPDNFVVTYGSEAMRVEGYFYNRKDGYQNIRKTILPDRYFDLGRYNTFSY